MFSSPGRRRQIVVLASCFLASCTRYGTSQMSQMQRCEQNMKYRAARTGGGPHYRRIRPYRRTSTRTEPG
eukprot:scaffold88360_cov23-Prasinocladus_malaysianus.AAC.1